MKKNLVFALAIALIGFAGSLSAQDGHNHEDHAGHNHGDHAGHNHGGQTSNAEQRFERMKKHLQLTEEQAQKIKAIMDNVRAQHDQASADGSITEEERASLRKARKSSEKEIDKVLTPEQREQFAQFKTKRQDRGKGEKPRKLNQD